VNTPAVGSKRLLWTWNSLPPEDTKSFAVAIAMLVHPSKQRIAPCMGLSLTYQEALREHLLQPGPETLQLALDLGRAAMTAGVSVSDLIRLHHQALADGLLPVGESAVPDGFASALDSFLLGALSSFEVSNHRAAGARDSRLGTRMEQLEEIAMLNADLQEEIFDLQRDQVALQESKDHYFQLYQNARAMEENLRELSAQVLTAQEEERKRISRELHDEIGQALTAINVSIAMLKRQPVSDPAFQRNVSEAEQLLARTMETVHSFARELRPAMLDHLGLQSALRAHILAFARRTGICTELVAHPDLASLDEGRGEVLFRVAQEALNNIYKHAHATAAKVEFTSADGYLDMEVGDNGCAFNVEKQLEGEHNGRLGLLGMQERVRLVKGLFSILSSPGSGTLVKVKIPIDGVANRHAQRAVEANGNAVARPVSCTYGTSNGKNLRLAR